MPFRKHAIGFFCTTLVSLASVLSPDATVLAAEPDANYAGYWQARSPGYVFRIASTGEGRFHCDYGFPGYGVWGRFDATRNHDQLTAAYRSHNSTGTVIMVLTGANRAILDWQANEPRNSGKVEIFRVDRNPQAAPLDVDPQEQSWRFDVIAKWAREAKRQNASNEAWGDMARRLRQEIEAAGKWPKGWVLPKRFRQMGWNDWEIGWIEIYFLEAVQQKVQRDSKPPAAELVYHRFHDPATDPRAGFADRHFTTYRDQNQNILKQFHRTAQRKVQVQGERLIRLYYAMWDYLTANESYGVIAWPTFDGLEEGEDPVIQLYNASHLPAEGTYRIKAYGGERLLAEGEGTIRIPPYEAKPVQVTVHSGYAFLGWQVDLQFTPMGYVPKPIPKAEVTPFFETEAEFLRLAGDKGDRLDFVDAMLWTRMREAWNANDLQKYTRAVRDAGGRLVLATEMSEPVRAYVRRHLEVLEQADTRPMPGLPQGESELTLPLTETARGDATEILTQIRTAQRGRGANGPPPLAPEKLRNPNAQLSPEARRRLDSVRRRGTRAEPPGNAQQADSATFTVALKDGYLVLGTYYWIIMTGHVTMYDGHVPLGTYSLDGILSRINEKNELPLVTAERMVTFYQDEPSYKIDLEFHAYHQPPRGDGTGRARYDFYERLNKIAPGARPDPRNE